MEDAPRPKRRRTDASDDTPLLVRSDDYWFHDGNIILQVQFTQFRLTESLLAMHSSVFRDMFSVPLPSDEATVEDCPVVVLRGDREEDWILFLGVLYPKSYAGEAPTVKLLAAMLRLSKKYDFAVFRKDCLNRLKRQFPTTLKEFDKVSSDWTFIKYEESSYRDLVSLAREIGLHSILPALYAGMLLKVDTYIEMILDQDGGFSATDRLACLTGYTNLLQQQLTTSFKWLNFERPHPVLPVETCRQRHKCLAAVKVLLLDFSLQSRPRVRAIARWDKRWEADLCVLCQKEARKVFREGKEVCWDGLPEAFGLPEWDDLKALDFDIE
ncbi:hypothetical protein B0H16DRAFT_1384313 [Mycena metata]|uniref:BTB domain-containing protein n=1 Tax=Mycena metata TaxID=1033252 RepID=A0AAD7HQQ5_9AGAR|nr:hypothetical protein B0H16DRAFT_1384313 [Mycena metata]